MDAAAKLIQGTNDLEVAFPRVDGESLRIKMFDLTYKQHGGSGTNLTLSEVMNMDWALMEWWYDHLSEQREEESAQLRKAGKAK